jgi:predicted acylesterase/phospholipase RssA
MLPQWKQDSTFHLGINMAGAVSAGAYTAGVLDFLTEALEQWYAAKTAGGPPVPQHDVSLDIFSGASAGGMCAAISAVMLQGPFQHIHNPADATVQNTTNRFYESWVNKIDIVHLLGDSDLRNSNTVVSLLDSTIIDEIADYALTPLPNPNPPRYLSPSLTLLLTLTNVRGVPFSLNGVADGSAEEDIAYYADRLQFETVQNADAKPIFAQAQPLTRGSNTGGWTTLKMAAKATGAFPLFLAPRSIDRSCADYANSPWKSIAAPQTPPVPPHWPLHESDVFTTLNVDGGVTDNDPFQLAHDFLAVQNPLAQRDPQTGELHNPPAAHQANCAVLTVAPFPARDLYNSGYDFRSQSSIFTMLPNLFSVLVAQSRFQGETLQAVMSGASFSRFVLAPSDAANANIPALQCGLLGAFGGFFERAFRAHDYQLGRRNCQKFLSDHFHLSITNPIIDAGLKKLGAADRDQVIKTFAPNGVRTFPIIPLCGSAVAEVTAPARATISKAKVDQIIGMVVKRLKTVAKPLLDTLIKPGLQDEVVQLGVDALIDTVVKNKVGDYLRTELQEQNAISQ